MGMLIDGRWDTGTHLTDSGGRFVRADAPFRHRVTPDGAPGPDGEGGFPAARGRYHLYAALFCPWAHRTLIYRRLQGLEDIVGLSITHWRGGDQGWTFEQAPGTIPDTVNHCRYMHELYTRAAPRHTGRATVPVLWDRERRTIVSNESADIIRMFDGAFAGVGGAGPRWYPEALRAEIDSLNARIYATVNNGVYRCGFATTQAAYDEAAAALFESLDWLEARLARQRYLCGAEPTEADWRLLPTLLRFDPVYHGLFRCNRRRLVDYPHLWGYTRDLYQWPGIRETVNFEHIVRGYYETLTGINPSGIVPIGPQPDFDAPHGRG